MRAESRVAPRPSNHTYESIEPDRFTFVMDRSVDAQRSPPASCQVGSRGIYLARDFLPPQKGDPDRFCLCRLSRRCRLGLAGSIARLEAFILAERIHPVGIRDRFDRDAVDVMAKGRGSRDRDLIPIEPPSCSPSSRPAVSTTLTQRRGSPMCSPAPPIFPPPACTNCCLGNGRHTKGRLLRRPRKQLPEQRLRTFQAFIGQDQ